MDTLEEKLLVPKGYENAFVRLFICTEVDIPTELLGMTRVSLLLMLISCLLLCL